MLILLPLLVVSHRIIELFSNHEDSPLQLRDTGAHTCPSTHSFPHTPVIHTLRQTMNRTRGEDHVSSEAATQTPHSSGRPSRCVCCRREARPLLSCYRSKGRRCSLQGTGRAFQGVHCWVEESAVAVFQDNLIHITVHRP